MLTATDFHEAGYLASLCETYSVSVFSVVYISPTCYQVWAKYEEGPDYDRFSAKLRERIKDMGRQW